MVLKALSAVYGAITRLRNWGYDHGAFPRFRAEVPVISIGNVTVGGNAKTPLTIFLVKELAARGWRPVVVTRGYGGAMAGPHLVAAADRPEVVGDEPCLMAHRHGATVVVARDRAAGADFVKRNDLGDIVVLDDGFQHRRLARDVDIVAVNVGTPEARAAFQAGELLPAGRFREDRRRALRRADIVVCAERRPDPGEPLAPEILACLPRGVGVYRSFTTPLPLRPLVDGASSPIGGEVVAFCGIASPESFFLTLEGAGFTLKERKVFRDHYLFSAADIEALGRAHPGIPLVCTEKDALKLPRSAPNVYVLGIETRVFPSDAFMSQIERLVRESTKRIV